jgi:hypothetical protein
VGSNIDTGLVPIQGTGVGWEATPVFITAPQLDAMRAIARTAGTRRCMCDYNVEPGVQLQLVKKRYGWLS